MRPLRVLCLHGFRSSGEQLRARLEPLLSGFEPQLETMYPDAPEAQGWWDAVPRSGPLGSKRYEGWLRTRDWLSAYVAERKPVAGVFGFSQGAALAALLAGSELGFEFAILASGFVSNDPEHADLYRHLSLRSLHLVGRADRIVPREASLALAARFDAPVLFEHTGGHRIPSDAAARAAVDAFLRVP